jgi:hypothetical protein
MDYTISKADGTTLLSVPEGQVTSSAGYSVTFVGKNFPAYGSYINNNFLRLLENSAKNTAPSVPVKGQIWYDTNPGVNQIKVYNGTVWNLVGGSPVYIGDTAPTSPITGQLWYENNDLGRGFIYTGTQWVDFSPAKTGSSTSSSSSPTLTVKDEGTNLSTAVTSIDFVGAGVTATNSSGAVTVTIPGGGGSTSSSSYTLPTASSSTLGGVKVDGTSITINSTTGVISTGTLDSLSDVVITAPAANQVLLYNSTTSQWVNGALNLSNNADIADLKKKLFLLEKFGAVIPTVKTPPSPVPAIDADGNVFNILSADIFVGRGTWSNRIYSSAPNTSVPSAQLFENTSGYAIDLIIKVSITASADDPTQFKMLIDSTSTAYSFSDIQSYSGAGFQSQQNNVYTYTARVPAGQTYKFEMQGQVGPGGSNGRGLDFVAGMMYINFGGWVI